MKPVLLTILAFCAFILVITGVGLWFNGVDLLWMPFQVHQQTKIVRASDGYITAQQQMLREYRNDYSAASPEQRAGIIRQMDETADLISGSVQPDIAAFIAAHRGE